MTFSTRSLLTFTAVAALSSSSFAAILLPNTLIPATPISGLLGTLFNANANPFVGKNSFNNVVFTGSEVTTDLIADPSNPFGGLTFVYTVHNDNTSIDPLDRITLTGFRGFNVDAVFVVDGNVAPVSVDRSFNGDTIGFNFSIPNAVNPGQTTDRLVLRTDALSDLPNTLTAIDGGSGSATSIGPAAPEPASLGLVSLGGLLLLRRRRA